jgi:hypothetical protein
VTVERHARGAPATPTPKKRKLSKRTVKAIAWVGGAVAFALPWAVIQAVPRPVVSAGTQLVVVPSGSHVVITQPTAGASGGVVVTPGKGGGGAVTAPAVATTGGSAPPPPGV